MEEEFELEEFWQFAFDAHAKSPGPSQIKLIHFFL